jgi:tetratricopeptide (TPR) repeat protein
VLVFACFAEAGGLFGGDPAQSHTQTAAPAQQPQTAPKTQQPPDESNPPEEDESVAPRTYAFDPLQSERSIKIGNFYMHQGTARGFRAALGRYEDATKYNPSSAEAFFKVAEAEEKLKNKDAARIAFQRVIQLAPDSKLAQEAKKKLGSKS